MLSNSLFVCENRIWNGSDKETPVESFRIESSHWKWTLIYLVKVVSSVVGLTRKAAQFRRIFGKICPVPAKFVDHWVQMGRIILHRTVIHRRRHQPFCFFHGTPLTRDSRLLDSLKKCFSRMVKCGWFTVVMQWVGDDGVKWASSGGLLLLYIPLWWSSLVGDCVTFHLNYVYEQPIGGVISLVA